MARKCPNDDNRKNRAHQCVDALRAMTRKGRNEPDAYLVHRDRDTAEGWLCSQSSVVAMILSSKVVTLKKNKLTG